MGKYVSLDACTYISLYVSVCVIGIVVRVVRDSAGGGQRKV